MNYQKIHDQIIERAKTRKLQGYKERHHIIPKCLGGTDDTDNLVDLTAREHFIIHKLLCEIYPTHKGIQLALYAMVNWQSSKNQRDYIISSREFEFIKINAIEAIREAQLNRDPATRTHSSETKKKISNALTGKPKSKTHRKNMGTSLKGKTPWNKGKTGVQKYSAETREKMRQSRLRYLESLKQQK